MRRYRFLVLSTVMAGMACGGGDPNIGLRGLGGDASLDGTDGTPGFNADGFNADASMCRPRSCAAAGTNCGPVADGCGGLLQCGTCNQPEACGAGGKPSVCGTNASCSPKTCAEIGANCGPMGDGCGGLLDCGKCPAGASCGTAGPSKCGPPLATDGGLDGGSCVKTTCAGANANCGPIGDGCGGALNCGTCTKSGEVCGGGGKPSLCGNSTSCTATTCATIGANCGLVGDGCGKVIDCGKCTKPGDQCGGGGQPSVCGNSLLADAGLDAKVCHPATCAAMGANCGPIGDGCGNQLDCGKCSPPQICGGSGKPSVCGGFDVPDGGTPCTGLCTQRVACAPAGGVAVTTTISGTVLAPTPPQFGTPDPLYDAIVYVPNGKVDPFTPGVSCDKCGALASGSPLSTAITGPDGKFVLKDVPVGTNIPLVIQLGRWRRQVKIPQVTPCQDNPLGPELTRLPRTKAEGDIPLMSMATGDVDTLECVLRKIGIDDSEFTQPTGNGRVRLYVSNGADAGQGTPDESTLWNNPMELAKYDMVLFPCDGGPHTEAAQPRKNVLAYANGGGRIFATHYSYAWLYQPAAAKPGKPFVPFSDFATTAQWNVDQAHPTSGDLVPLTALVDTSFPKGKAFSQWLDVVGASSAPGSGQIDVYYSRHDLDGVNNPPAQRWMYSQNPDTIQHYTFNTPVTVAPQNQCGRVVFSDFHVNNIKHSGGLTFPKECKVEPMSAQEKVLEFMLFDLASCVTSDATPPPPPPTCTPRTCAAQNIFCGPAGDGCGGLLNCGPCTGPDQTCGGGGTPGVCGGPPCTPRTACPANVHCGPFADGCGGIISCGVCTQPETCGGGGVPATCGKPACTPIVCPPTSGMCGPLADGCGGLTDCGPCTKPGETCGGGGTASVCGATETGTCAPQTCDGKCGPNGDGCGGLIMCQPCPSNCLPTTCAVARANCGPIGDGCGGVLDCGTCPAPQSCGGGGTPSQCGGGIK